MQKVFVVGGSIFLLVDTIFILCACKLASKYDNN